MVEAVAGVRDEIKNGLFAELRKAGVLGNKEKAPEPTPASNPTPAPAASLSERDIERVVIREQSLGRAEAMYGLDEKRLTHLRRAIGAENPADIGAFVNSFASDMGWQRVTTTAPSTPIDNSKTAQPAPTTPAAGAATQPATGILGPASPGDSRDSEAVLVSRPQEATGHDFERLVVKHGMAKALEMWSANVNAYLRTVKVVPPGRRTR